MLTVNASLFSEFKKNVADRIRFSHYQILSKHLKSQSFYYQIVKGIDSYLSSNEMSRSTCLVYLEYHKNPLNRGITYTRSWLGLRPSVEGIDSYLRSNEVSRSTCLVYFECHKNPLNKGITCTRSWFGLRPSFSDHSCCLC